MSPLRRLVRFVFVASLFGLTLGPLPAAALGDLGEEGAGDEVKRPNVVLFLVDDLGVRDLGCYGSTLYETPHADRLASRGVRFTNAYAAYPRCVPSRVGLLSGKYPARIEGAQFAMKRSDPDRSPHALPLGEVTFGEAFRQAGYATCYIGKWHLGHGEDGNPLDGGPGQQGFQTVIHSGSAGATGSFFPEDGEYPVEKNNAVANPVTGESGDDLTGRLTDEAVGYIADAAGDAPFLMVLAHYDVHTPLEAGDEGVEKYRRKLRLAGIEKGNGRDDADYVRDRAGMTKTVQNNPTYAAMVERTDASLGRVLAALEAAGAGEDTVVLFTSDHGGLSTRGLNNRRQTATSNAPYRQGKGSIFDGGLRVPLIVRDPRNERAGALSDARVHGVDLYPTMLDLAGLPARPGQHVDGVSFAPALKGEAVNRPPLFWYKWRARPDSTGDTRSTALIEGDFKIVEWLDDESIGRFPPEKGGGVGAEVELFDLSRDPGERTNLAGAQPERAAALLKKMRALEEDLGNLRARGGGGRSRRGETD